MDRYRNVVNSLFEDGIVIIMRVRLVLMFTKHVADGDRERYEDYWSEFYHTSMSLSQLTRHFEDHKSSKD
jgi:hypothetical protein